MQKGIVGKILVNLTSISLIILAIGVLIQSITLHKYRLIDFEIFRPRSLFIGATFAFFYFIHLLLPLTFVLFHTIWSPLNLLKQCAVIIFLHLFYSEALANILGGGSTEHLRYLQTAMASENAITIFTVCRHLSGSALICGAIILFFDRSKMRHKWIITVASVVLFVGAFAIIIVLALLWNNGVTKEVVTFEAINGLALTIVLVVGHFVSQAYNKPFFRPTAERTPVAQGGTEEELRIFKSELRQKSFGVIATVMLSGALLGITYSYAKYIFPYIKPELGGGKLDEITLVVNGQELKGLRVHETSSYVYLQYDKHRIRKIPSAEIEEIIMKK